MLGVLTKLLSLEVDVPHFGVTARGTTGLQGDQLEGEAQQSGSNDGGEGSASNASPSPQWLSYYAKIAPQEIRRWVNPEDGSGVISYQQLVENLNLFNIPVLPMKPFASPEGSGTRDPDQPSSVGTVSHHKGTQPEMSSGAAFASETGGTRQGSLYSSADPGCSGVKSLPGRSTNGSADLRASAEDRDGLTAEGVNDLPASGHLGSEAQLTKLYSNTCHNGTTLMPSGLHERGDDLRTSAMKIFPSAADCQAQLERTAPDEGALRVPVSATHTTYIGPVREFRGTLSGVRDCGMTRPGPHSQVPPDYVRVLNSEVRVVYDTEKHAHGLAQTSHVVSRTATGAGGPSEGDAPEKNGAPLEPGAAAVSLISEAPPHTGGYGHMQAVGKDCGASTRLPIKPPPIFLAPVLKTGPERRSLEGEVTLSTRWTEAVKRKKTSARDAHTGGITYSLGQYIWTAEDAATGTAQKGEPEMDAKVQRMCAGSVFPAVLQPECRSDDDTQVGTVEVQERADLRPQTAVDKIEDLGMPYVLELRREKIAYLRELSERTREFVRDDLYAVEAAQNAGAIVKSNKGGGGGLCAARSAKKASVVFVESPMLKAEMTPEGLWKVFQGLSEDQKKQLATLEGCAADLSETEALLCFLHCRSVNAGGRVVGAFQNFFGKMKMNAYALRCGEGWALYPHAAQIKHSCQPNVTYRSVEGLLVFIALTDIAEGSPLTMAYIDQLYMPTQERRKRVLACKRIFCECPRCSNPIQPERTILCPHCRSTKLCFIGEGTIQHAASENGNGAATEEKRADLQADVADASEGHLEWPADTPNPAAELTPGFDSQTGDVPLEQSKQNEPRAAVAHEKHIDSSCFNADLDADSAHSTDLCSHGPPSSRFSEPDMILPMRDKLCILGTTIAPKRAVAGGIKKTDIAKKWSVEAKIVGGKGRWLRDKDTVRSDGTGGVSANSDVESSGACAGSDTSLKDTEGGYSDDDTDSQGSSEVLCTSFLDACTSADSNGNCSSSELSEEEQEPTAEHAAADKCAGDKKPRGHAEDWKCTNSVLEQGENTAERKHDAHCVYEGEGRWSCAGCGRRFTDNDMPVALETYLTGYYAALRARLGRPTPEAWNGECGQLIRTVEKVLGVEHWLYVAGHLMLAQLYLGMWMGGHVVDVVLTQALRHAALVVSSASKPAFSAAKNVDIVPLVSAVLRILLFNGRFQDYIEWIERREALQFIREGIGTYDEIYIAFATAYLYVRKKIDEGSEPSLGPLHRFAHASQYTIALDAAYHERKEAEERERTARMLRAKAEEAEALNRARTLREQQINNIKRNIAALKTVSLPKKKQHAQDVTFTSPDSVVGQYLKRYVPPGAKISNTTAALCQGLHRHLGQDEEFRRTFGDAALATKVAYEQAKRVQQLAAEGQYPTGLLPSGGCPDTGYLPLIMLADPLKRSAQQLRLLRKSSKTPEREKDWGEQLKQTVHGCTNGTSVAVEEGHPDKDSKEHEDIKTLRGARGGTAATDQEKSFVYRIPGLSGTAPGEFVTISQINHTKDGRYPPIPFFRTFFYIDHEARNIPQRVGESEGSPLDIKVLGCGAEGVAALTKEELEDLAAARYNYLHTEAARFNEEARTALAFEMGRRAEEAAAALDSITSHDARNSVSREDVTPVSPLDIFQEVNKAVRDVTIKDAFVVKSVEEYREDRCKPDDDAIGIIMHTMKEGVGGEQRDVSAHRRNELPAISSVDDQSLEPGSSPATGQNVAALQKEGKRAPECPRGREWELQNLPPCPGGTQSSKTSLSLRKAGDKFACNFSADRTGAPKALVNVACARRFLKPLDFSRIPPPPALPAWAGSRLIALHPQYKLARAAAPSAYQRLQIHSPNPLPFSSVTAVQNPVVAALPLAPM